MKISKIVIFTLILVCFQTTANACKTGNSLSVAYLRRNNNRCEGIVNRNVSGRSGLNLISFVVSNLENYPNKLRIRVPGNKNQEPKIIVQSFIKRYRLDKLKTKYLDSNYIFDLDTRKILQHRNIKVPFKSLRYLAVVVEDSEAIYFPVVLGNNSGEYKFVISSSYQTTFPIIEIRYQGKVVHSESRNNPQQGHIYLNWNYQKQPAGRYTLYIENDNGDSRSFPFEHDPNWFL